MRVDLKPPRRTGGDDNIIPMINIVFLLLIFFMVAGQIKAMDSAGVELPDGDLGARARPEAITLAMDSHNRLSLNGAPVPLTDLDAALAPLLADSDRIALLADRSLRAADLDPVLAVIRARGVPRVSLLTTGLESP
ncbi:MAG: biopolymer transporter ExbD [Porticoccaceae bacterium]|jgi:biopolymer transport protein ExbD|nr:biopolymer transporter ExbD [Porticoccaceae bacterium]HLS99487.1 biopolymer transporter ExbD [Porticoccaceae bacterium]